MPCASRGNSNPRAIEFCSNQEAFLEPTAKIKKVAKGQSPAGKKIGSECLVACVRSFHLHLSTHQFVAFTVAGELTKFLETQLGKCFDGHGSIMHLNQTPGAGGACNLRNVAT